MQFPHLLDESRHLLLNFLEPGLGVGGLGEVHLVNSDDELLHAQGVGEQSMLREHKLFNLISESFQEYSGDRFSLEFCLHLV